DCLTRSVIGRVASLLGASNTRLRNSPAMMRIDSDETAKDAKERRTRDEIFINQLFVCSSLLRVLRGLCSSLRPAAHHTIPVANHGRSDRSLRSGVRSVPAGAGD